MSTPNDFTLYPPDVFAEKAESGELKSFIAKRYIQTAYEAGVFTEGHDGFLPHVDKTERSRTKLDQGELVDYYRNAWDNGLNQEHALVKALLGTSTTTTKPAATKTAAEKAPAAAGGRTRTATATTTPAATPPSTSRPTEPLSRPAAPDDGNAGTARVLAAIQEHSGTVMAAISDLPTADVIAQIVDDALARHLAPVDNRFNNVDLGIAQVKAGVSYAAEVSGGGEAGRADALEIMNMPLDELVAAGFTAP